MPAPPMDPKPPVARNVADDVLRRELRRVRAGLVKLRGRLAVVGAEAAAEDIDESIGWLDDAEIKYVGAAKPASSSYLQRAVAIVRAGRGSRSGDEEPEL